MKQLNVEELKEHQLSILKQVDIWCREHKVRYFLGYGTLLGAVRHQGYIPWDDDIDIVMLRPDYERLLREFNQNRTDSLQVLHTTVDSIYPYPFAKVHDRSTKMIEKTAYPYEIGINIDIFPLDNLQNGPQDIPLIQKKCRWIQKVYSMKVYGFKPSAHRFLKRTALELFSSVSKRVPMGQLMSQWEGLVGSCGGDGQRTEWVGAAVTPWFCRADVFPARWFQDVTELPFEGCRFPAPAEYDQVLTTWFGDYMQFPPEEERVTHHSFTAYAPE